MTHELKQEQHCKLETGAQYKMLSRFILLHRTSQLVAFLAGATPVLF